MVHNHFYTFTCCILMNFFYIKIWIRCDKVKYVIFALAKPIFPSLIPSFYQYTIKSMCGSKINITFYVSCVGRMFAVCFRFRIICFTQFYAGQLVGISP